ncbi:MAG: Asp-tRNA(Asn)/Glu-tRNA(Gln) amidotransferase subunit GatC [Candidatus Uhrbacteria bacterium]|nr:Asp-tRNA(Asn)/Glu-tRNA(Gln) amidotransferase subunit GatC [Candidatus Uhrbacteria bacterium]
MPNIEFDVDKVAKLALLDLTDKDRADFKDQLPSIVAYISKLHEVDTSEVDAKMYITDQVNIFREDEIINCDQKVRDACIDAFPKKTGDALEVPGVFDIPEVNS